jgi:hypothetical protein
VGCRVDVEVEVDILRRGREMTERLRLEFRIQMKPGCGVVLHTILDLYSLNTAQILFPYYFHTLSVQLNRLAGYIMSGDHVPFRQSRVPGLMHMDKWNQLTFASMHQGPFLSSADVFKKPERTEKEGSTLSTQYSFHLASSELDIKHRVEEDE